MRCSEYFFLSRPQPLKFSHVVQVLCVQKLQGARMSYSSSSLPSYSGGSTDNARMMDQVRSQVAVASAQELIQKMSDKCFRKCIYSPGAELDSKQQKCLAMCMDRYMEAWNITSKAYNAKLQRH